MVKPLFSKRCLGSSKAWLFHLVRETGLSPIVAWSSHDAMGADIFLQERQFPATFPHGVQGSQQTSSSNPSQSDSDWEEWCLTFVGGRQCAKYRLKTPSNVNPKTFPYIGVTKVYLIVNTQATKDYSKLVGSVAVIVVVET